MWFELKISLPGDDLKEPVTAVLYENGCIGLREDAGSLTAYFPAEADAKSVLEALSYLEGISYTETTVPEQDWYASWKEKFQPVHAEGLVICPPWLDCEPGPGERPLILDPAQAFGAGDHVTTLTVLKMLHGWVREKGDLRARKFLDLGTGTGILAVAALLYGFGDVTAVDVERSAVEAATRNLMLNGLSGRARIALGGIGEAGAGFDLIAANLFQEPLLEIMPRIPATLNNGGALLISGLLEGQEPPVLAAAGDAGLEVAEAVNTSGWVSARLFFQRGRAV